MCPIQLIQDDEQLELAYEGSVIEYRRLPAKVRARFVKRCTKKGVTDMEKVTELGLAYCITGWRTVQVKGKNIPFDPELIPALPQDAREEIAEKGFIGGLDEPTGETEADDSPLGD